MKKNYCFLALLLANISHAQTVIEDFENGIPPTWATFETGSGVNQSWTTNTNPLLVCQGSSSAYINRENVPNGTFAIDWLVSPLITVPANGKLFFATKTIQTGMQGNIFSVRVSTTSQTDVNSFITVEVWDENTLTTTANLCQQKIVDLSSYVGQTVYIAFVMQNDNGDRWIVDDIKMYDNIIIPMAFIDTNNNGNKESNEQYFTGGNFQISTNANPVVNYGGANGNVVLYPSNSSDLYNIGYTIHPEFSSYYSSSGLIYNNISLASLGANPIVKFPITVNYFLSDVEVNVTTLKNPFMPGGKHSLLISYKNNGSLIESGTLQYTKPTNLTAPSNTYDINEVQTPTGFTLNYTNLLPQETRYLSVKTLIPTIPTVQIGENLSATVTISATNVDVYPNNNSFVTNHLIGAAYDPNDKCENNGPTIIKDDFTNEDYLVYTIRFQNIGTISTSTVRVEDYLDAKLNPATVRMIYASHDYVLSIQNNHLVWKFDPIYLTPQSVDDEKSEGYITFKVKPNPGYQVGDIIPNTASIYFDSNPAIVTNTFQTEFIAALANESFTTDSVAIYPNPSNDFVNIELGVDESRIQSITITDVLGKKVFESKFQNKINISNLNQGVYFLTLTSNDNQKVVKRIIKE